MKKKLTNNFGMKLASLALAVVIWLVIRSIADPPDTKTFSNVPVEIRNVDVLTAQDDKYTYSILSGDTAAFSVEATTSVTDRLSASDFYVYADMSKLSVVGSVPVEIIPKNASLGITVLPHSNTLMVEIDELVEKSVNVEVNLQGNLREGYTAGDITCMPNLVKVRGPKTIMDTVDALMVDVNISGQGGLTDENGHMKQQITATETDPVLYDMNGEKISSPYITIDLPQPVSVSIDILKTETVNVELSFDGFKAAEGFAIVGEAEYSPRTITLAGQQDALQRFLADKADAEGTYKLKYVVSGNGVEPLKQNLESYFELQVGDEIRIVEESVREKGIPYRINVEEKITGAYPTSFDKIKLIGANPEYTYTLDSADGSDKLTFHVTGIAAAMDQLGSADESGISLSVDVTGQEPGTYTFPVKGTFPGGVTLDGGQEITIVIEGPEET